MSKIKIGESFPEELAVAGLVGLPFSWGTDGSFNYGDEITDEQKAKIKEVYVTHDPSKKAEGSKQ